jgi:potassium efflux system protein
VLDAILKLLLKRPAGSRFGVVARHSEPLLKSLGSLLNVAALAVWVVVALISFHVYQPVADSVSDVLGYPIEVGQISITLGGVLLFLVSVWVSLWLAKLVRIALRDAVLPNIELPHGASNSIATLSYYAVATVGLLVALAATGLQLSQLTIVVGALGVGIGFGLQNIVNNFVSGLILMFERPIQPGDVVEVAGASGTVLEIGMRATRLRTSEGADVVVPNGTLLSQNLLNWTLSDKSRRLDVNVGVAFGGDLKRVLEILMDAATTTPGLATSPPPSVNFLGIGNNSLNFAISAWTNDFDNCGAVRSAMMGRVYDALMAAGIEMPFPQQDLQLRTLSPEARTDLAGAGPVPAG